MSVEFLKRLYWPCAESPDNGFAEGLNLSELYERIEDTKQADKAFTATVESTGLNVLQKSELEDACIAVSDAYELQGFINGFRLCAQLGRELCGEKEADS